MGRLFPVRTRHHLDLAKRRRLHAMLMLLPRSVSRRSNPSFVDDQGPPPSTPPGEPKPARPPIDMAAADTRLAELRRRLRIRILLRRRTPPTTWEGAGPRDRFADPSGFPPFRVWCIGYHGPLPGKSDKLRRVLFEVDAWPFLTEDSRLTVRDLLLSLLYGLGFERKEDDLYLESEDGRMWLLGEDDVVNGLLDQDDHLRLLRQRPVDVIPDLIDYRYFTPTELDTQVLDGSASAGGEWEQAPRRPTTNRPRGASAGGGQPDGSRSAGGLQPDGSMNID